MYKKISSGLSLFEVVFAVGLVALILTAIVLLSTRSIKTSDFSQNRAMAGKYAQEATEWFRIQRDNLGWADFVALANSNEYCLSDLSDINNRTLNICSITGTIFSRGYKLSGDNSKIQLVIRILWTDSDGPHEVLNTTEFTNWNK